MTSAISVTNLLLKELATSTAPTPGGDQVGKLYQQWSTCEGAQRADNLSVVVNEMFSVIKIQQPDPNKTQYFDVATGMRKEAVTEERFEEYVMGQAAERAAKALVLLDIFGETGVIELQTAYANHMEKILHEYEDRPPF